MPLLFSLDLCCPYNSSFPPFLCLCLKPSDGIQELSYTLLRQLEQKGLGIVQSWEFWDPGACELGRLQCPGFLSLCHGYSPFLLWGSDSFSPALGRQSLVSV